MKKIIMLLLALSLIGCSSNNDNIKITPKIRKAIDNLIITSIEYGYECREKNISEENCMLDYFNYRSKAKPKMLLFKEELL